jgi:hypothetical protein
MMTHELRHLLDQPGWSKQAVLGGWVWQKRIDFTGGDVHVTWAPLEDHIAVSYHNARATTEQVEQAAITMRQVTIAAGLVRIIEPTHA